MSSHISDITIDLTSDTSDFTSEPYPLIDSVDTFFDLNFPSSFGYCYDPSRPFIESLSCDFQPNINIPDIPDIVHKCSNLNDFLFLSDYVSTCYSTDQFLIDYIYFLENLCSLTFDSSVLFKTFIDFQSSKHLYELNQLVNILNYYPQEDLFNFIQENIPDFSILEEVLSPLSEPTGSPVNSSDILNFFAKFYN
jgi:hypothetical protein